MDLLQHNATLLGRAVDLIQYTATLAGEQWASGSPSVPWAGDFLKYNATLPRSSGQWISFNTLPQCPELVSSESPPLHWQDQAVPHNLPIKLWPNLIVLYCYATNHGTASRPLHGIRCFAAMCRIHAPNCCATRRHGSNRCRSMYLYHASGPRANSPHIQMNPGIEGCKDL